MKKIKSNQIIRHFFQIGSFILCAGLFVIVLSSIESIYKAVLAGTFSLNSLKYEFITLLSVIPITMLFGRFFCGWLCAFGSMQELVYALGNKLGIKRIKLNKTADMALKYIKYAVLITLFFLWSNDADYNSLSPWNVWGLYSSYENWTDLSVLFTFGGAILLLIIVFSLFFERGFCKYFCPVGAIYGITSKIRIYGIKKNDGCVNCNMCSKVCPMGIDVAALPSDGHILRSPECINCLKCVDNCHLHALKTNSKEVLTGTLATAAIAGTFLVGTAIDTESSYTTNTEIANYSVAESSGSKAQSSNSDAQNDTSDTKSSTANIYVDGTYSGSGKGFRGTTTLSVTIENGIITNITIDSYRDDAKYFSKAKNTIISRIITAQSTNVATVTGATYSSKGIISAVSNALKTASET